MKIRLPFVGTFNIGKQDNTALPSVVAVTDKGSKEKFLNVLGSVLQLGSGRLSNEKIISNKLLAANKEWVYRNNDVIAQEVSKMQFELFSIGLSKGEIVYREIEEHPLLDLLDKFNSATTKGDGVYITQSDKKLTGDAFWLLQRNGKQIESIYILPPDKIELVLSDPTDSTTDLVEAYLYEDTIDGKRISQRYERDEVIHFKKPNPNNPFRGIGAVEALADTIDADTLTNLTQRNFFDKGALSNFVLTTEANLTEEQLKRMRAEFRAAYTGPKNAFTTMIFGNGLKPSDIGFSNKDMQFLDLLLWYRDKIMIGFGNTKASIGIIDDVNRASYEGSYQGWLRSTVKPDMDAIVNTLNEFLVPFYDNKLVLGYTDPIPDDRTDDIEESVKLKDAGIIMINEARAMVDFDPVKGGDIFAPSSSSTAKPAMPDDPEPPEPKKPPSGDDDAQDEEQEEAAKRVRYMSTNRRLKRKLGNVPSGLRHLPIEQLLRKRKIFTMLKSNQALKDAAKPMIRKMLKKKSEIEPRIHPQFTNDQLQRYYDKQIHIASSIEARFSDAVTSFIGKVEESTLQHLDAEVASRKGLKKFISKEIFDHEQLQVQAELDFFPLLMEQVVLAGQEAFRLIGVEDTYMPFKLQDVVRENVRKFTASMLDTDREAIVRLISEGISNGDSMPEIRSRIQGAFVDIKKVQAERITRTEVLRASNMAALDAFKQSGVVKAMQWLVAPNACPICLPFSGKIVGLTSNFYNPQNEFEDGKPPKHVACRCILIPIVLGSRAYEPVTEYERKLFQKRINELEGLVDKRTKAFKVIKTKQLDDLAYIKALEGHLGVNDDQQEQ